MKKLLFVLATCLVFVACESEFGDFNKVRFQGKDISGYWITVQEVYADKTYDCTQWEPEMYCFDGDIMTYYRALFVNGGWSIEDGYVSGCTFEDFTKRNSEIFVIRGNELYSAGQFLGNLTLQDNDTIIIVKYDDDDESKFVFKRVKGFK